MFAAQYSRLTIFLIASLLPVKFGVDGYGTLCPGSAAVNLTGETPDNLGFVNKSGDVFPPEVLWFANSTFFGCPCNFKVCVPLCCPVGYAGSVNGCVTDNFTIQSSPDDYEKSTRNRHVFINDPCNLSWTNDMLQRENYILLRRGVSLFSTNRFKTLDRGGFCIVRKQDTWDYFSASCIVSESNHQWICLVACTSIFMFFALTTFIVYTVTPELKNLPGLILRCYLASYISSTFLLSLNTALTTWLQFSSEIRVLHSLTSVLGFFYFGLACMLWLNVMSFDIWRTFRKFRSDDHDNAKAHQTSKFVRYSIYAWGCPALCTLFILFLNGLGTTYDLSESISESIKWYMIMLLFIGIAICNACLYTSTALTIRQRKKETAHMVNGVNKHQTENEQRFNLYVKLFVIMGAPQILSIIAFYSHNTDFYCVIYIIQALQSIAIFFMFVWKDEVIRLLRERFYKIIRRLCTVFQHYTTPMIKN